MRNVDSAVRSRSTRRCSPRASSWLAGSGRRTREGLIAGLRGRRPARRQRRRPDRVPGAGRGPRLVRAGAGHHRLHGRAAARRPAARPVRRRRARCPRARCPATRRRRRRRSRRRPRPAGCPDARCGAAARPSRLRALPARAVRPRPGWSAARLGRGPVRRPWPGRFALAQAPAGDPTVRWPHGFGPWPGRFGPWPGRFGRRPDGALAARLDRSAERLRGGGLVSGAATPELCIQRGAWASSARLSRHRQQHRDRAVRVCSAAVSLRASGSRSPAGPHPCAGTRGSPRRQAGTAREAPHGARGGPLGCGRSGRRSGSPGPQWDRRGA